MIAGLEANSVLALLAALDGDQEALDDAVYQLPLEDLMTLRNAALQIAVACLERGRRVTMLSTSTAKEDGERGGV